MKRLSSRGHLEVRHNLEQGCRRDRKKVTHDGSEATRRRTALITALSQTGGGDQQAFRVVYDMTAPKLFGVCLRICGERQAAEDVLQEVYLIIWKRAASYEPARGNPISWLCTIARNRALDWHRSSSPRRREAAEAGDDAAAAAVSDHQPLADHLLLLEEQHQRLSLCLDSLDDRPRAAIYAAFIDGLTYADVAARSAVPLPTMKSLIRRALLRLRECLRDD